MSRSSPPPVLIIGAGISGLILAHALSQRNVPFQVFERDASSDARSGDQGWGLTIHWALPILRELVPVDLQERFPEWLVNRGAVERAEKGSFTFFNLATGEARWQSPAKDRIRVSREKFRNGLTERLDVKWGKRLTSFSTTASGVTARFDDDTFVEGSVLVGCDGAHSRVRALCHPSGDYQARELPARLLGVTVKYSAARIRQVLALDPYFFQGHDPGTDVFLYFSYLDVPEPDQAEPGTEQVTCQIIFSWPYRPGFLGREEPTDVPASAQERVTFMKRLTAGWAEPFRSLVQDLPPDIEPKTIRLEDWVPTAERIEAACAKGSVTLIGDAAHPMTMFRGDAANHAILDAKTFCENVTPYFYGGRSGNFRTENLAAAVSRFEQERDGRCQTAVLASRQACLDAHEHERLNEDSPLVSRRPPVPA